MSSEEDGGKALAVSQFQQCCEKALKAVMLLEAGRNLYGQVVKPTHKIWTVDLMDSRLTKIRRKVRKTIVIEVEKTELILGKLENYAPRMSWSHENTEYPWVDMAGNVYLPAEYFKSRAGEVLNFGIFSRSLLKRIKAHYNPKFNNAWTTVEQIKT